jgi:hypothetical protein
MDLLGKHPIISDQVSHEEIVIILAALEDVLKCDVYGSVVK